MSAVVAILGIVLLLFGRTLFWLFVAGTGFLLGVELASVVFANQPQWITVLVAIAAGIVGGIVGIVAQRLAFALGGFFAGGYVALMIAAHGQLPLQPIGCFAIGGILGAVVAFFIMDWAIIVLSSLAGATALVTVADVKPTTSAVLVLLLTIVGIAVQGRRLTRPVPPSVEA
jgi:hypothetical protein